MFGSFITATFLDNGVKRVVSNDMVTGFRAEYAKMIRKVKKAMEKYINDPENDYTVEDMIINLCSSDNGLSVFSTDENLRKAKTVSEVFLFISQKCSMYDYEVLNIFIKSTDCEEAIQIVESFTAELEDYLLRHLNLASCDLWDTYTLPSGKRRKLTIEYRGSNLKYENKNLIRSVICEKFGLPEASVQFVAAIKGSVNSIFEISVEVKEHLLQHRITNDMVTSFVAYRISCLIIDDEMELKVLAGYVNEVTSCI